MFLNLYQYVSLLQLMKMKQLLGCFHYVRKGLLKRE